jgi:hypothetical protein
MILFEFISLSSFPSPLLRLFTTGFIVHLDDSEKSRNERKVYTSLFLDLTISSCLLLPVAVGNEVGPIVNPSTRKRGTLIRHLYPLSDLSGYYRSNILALPHLKRDMSRLLISLQLLPEHQATLRDHQAQEVSTQHHHPLLFRLQVNFFLYVGSRN